MDGLVFVLSTGVGFLGLVLGAFVSTFAASELKTGKRYFQWFRNAGFLFAIGIFSYNYGILYLVCTLLVVSLLLRVVEEKHLFQATTVLFFIGILWGLHYSIHEPLLQLFFVTSILQGGILAADHRKLIKKKAKFWKSILKASLLHIVVPVILLIASLFLF